MDEFIVKVLDGKLGSEWRILDYDERPKFGSLDEAHEWLRDYVDESEYLIGYKIATRKPQNASKCINSIN